MKNRLEIIRKEVDKIILGGNPEKVCLLVSHIYSVSQFCTLLALKRKLDVELAATCGMLHDIYYVTDETGENHDKNGAKLAFEILENTRAYTNEEITLIITAIANHCNKLGVDGEYDELLKDADVLAHCLYNRNFPVAEWEIKRYNNLIKELDID